MDATTQYAALTTALILLIAFLMFQPNSLVKWLQKKNYQYEVTFALYMLTPTEKFIFNSVLFLMLSMFSIMCILYLPNHVATISKRAYYYFAGDAAVAAHIGETAKRAYETALNTASAAQGTVEKIVA